MDFHSGVSDRDGNSWAEAVSDVESCNNYEVDSQSLCDFGVQPDSDQDDGIVYNIYGEVVLSEEP